MTRIASTAIRKAVIPAAGLGTRMLPITKAIPKEMFPLANRPIIQYAVEEAAASGIEEVILVTRAGKSVLETYFASAPALELSLHQQGGGGELELLRTLSARVRISAVYQSSPRGLGDALRCAQSTIGNEPFAVILPDALVVAQKPVLAQLMAAYQYCPGSFVATQRVEESDVCKFGMLAVEPLENTFTSAKIFQVSALIEKPSVKDSPSLYGIFGRYLLQPEIFNFLNSASADPNGEIQLTDCLAQYCQTEPLYALCFEGTHYDTGDKVGYLRASVDFALRDPEVCNAVHKYLTTLNLS
jgi:UTP--glucose-1-phosphate uridylyltransferase